MAKRFLVADWVAAVSRAGNAPERDRLLGVSVTLAAKLLGISRSRVHQLVKGGRLSVVDVFAGPIRIGHLVTLASIQHRRRTARRRRTQWAPTRP